MLIENQLLSSVIDNGNFFELDKYGIAKQDFPALAEAYSFIKNYVGQYGQVPDMLTVTDNCEDFEYTETTDNFKYMATTLKSETAKRKFYQLLQEQVPDKFEHMNGKQFSNWITQQATVINDEVDSAGYNGTDLAKNGAERLNLYLEAKEEPESKNIPTPYPTLTEYLGGGFQLGDYVLLQAFSNKGKSWMATDFGVKSWNAGFPVIDYRPEISREQFMQRWDTVNSHFNNMALKAGNLYEQEEQRYFDYLGHYTGTIETPYILKTMEDLPNGLSLEVLETDLKQHPDTKMVIIDGFLLMNHHGNSRDALSATSRKLRQLFSRHKVCGFVVNQIPGSAEKEQQNTAEDSRLPEAPKLTDYSETVATIQDAVTVLTFNQRDGIGVLKLAKAKTPNVDQQLELICNFNMGTIKEREILDDI